MPDLLDPETMIQRDDKARRGLDPDFTYSTSRFATVAALHKNIPFFINHFGINFVVFLLLTFRSFISLTEARRRFNNLCRRFLPNHFGHWICIVEATKTGRWHLHLIIQAFQDVRTGFDFPAYRAYILANQAASAGGPRLTCRQRRAMRDAIPANDYLRSLWQALDEWIPAFEFGPIFDAFPIETNGVAVSKYLRKGFLASLPRLLPAEKKLVTYSRHCPRAVPPGWRPPSRWFEERLQALLPVFGCSDRSQLKERLGKRWAFGLMELIGWLVFDHTENWHCLSTATLAPYVLERIVTNPRVEHYLGTLRPEVEAAIRANPISKGPPPPLPLPGSLPE